MAAGEIFILLVVVVSVGVVAAMAVHSRRRERAADTSEAPPTTEAPKRVGTAVDLPDSARLHHLDEPLLDYIRRDFTPLFAEQTVNEALESLRSQPLGERIIYFYVVDAKGKLAGVVPTRRLLMAAPETPVADIMVGDVLTPGRYRAPCGRVQYL